ncbi:hypothetical protein FRB95_008080 [Tulasnella sp. JGI-2019a]|nr:hypothetical protein FRB95_008080 [Tulasnella sp. JGI-2019a]
MEQALDIPEILEYVLQQAQPASQAVSAQICRRWSRISLDILWRDMDSFYPLFQLLSPLRCVGDEWHFKADLYDANWERFDLYARRIRKLSYDDGHEYQGEDALASTDLFGQILLHRPTPNAPILPNLTSITWDASTTQSLTHILPFISPTVVYLGLSCRTPRDGPCAKLLRSLSLRNLSLSTFLLLVTFPGEEYLETLVSFLAGQKQLIRVGLPFFSATREVVGALATLPSLKRYTGWGKKRSYQIPLEEGMQFDWGPQSFGSLEELGFYTPALTQASEILARRGGQSLRTLYLACLSWPSCNKLRHLSTTLVTSHSRLMVLRLSLFSEAGPPNPLYRVDFDTIRPLLQCTALSTLLVWHNRPLAYTEEDVTEMGLAWPQMTSLELCPDPTSDVESTSGQPLRIVGTICRAFPKLENLAVYVNEAGLTPDVLEPGIALAPSRLKKLNLGTSPRPRPNASDSDSTGNNADDIALFIASVTPPSLKMCSSRSVGHLRGLESNEEERKEYEHRSLYWSDIAQKVRLVHVGMAYVASGFEDLARQNRFLREEVRRLAVTQGTLTQAIP